MSNALLAMIAKRKAAASRTKTISPNPGRTTYRIMPSWRIAKTAPAGVDAAKWTAAVLAALASNNPEALMKIGAAAQNCPAGYNTEAKLEWMLQFYADFGQHFVKDAAGKVIAVYVCASKTFGRHCSICDEVNKGILNSRDDVTKKRLEQVKAGGKVLMNVLEVSGPNAGTVQVLEVAPTVLQGRKGNGGILNKFTDWPNLLDLQNGAAIIVEKAGAGMDTTYDVSAVPSPLKYDLSILAQLHDLDAFVMQENPESQQRALAGVSAITGLLPAPSRPSLDQIANAAQVFDDIPDFATTVAEQAAAPAQAVTEAAPWDVMPETVVQSTPVQAPAPAVAPVVAAAPAVDALDQLLAGL